MEILILRLDAPLVAFGAPIVDNYGKVQQFPGLSLLVGLVGNALGYDHSEHEKLQRLQERIRYAVRCDRPGKALRDYQTVELSAPYMNDKTAWTSRGFVEERGGARKKTAEEYASASSKDIQERFRDYRADSIHTVALALVPADESPTVDEVESALRSPERPLFIGRKCCLPSGELLMGRARAEHPIEALKEWPRLPSKRSAVSDDEKLTAWWADGEGNGDETTTRLVPVTDERDWLNQLHGGQRMLRHGVIDPPRGAP